MSKFDAENFAQSELARYVSELGRICSREMRHLAEGMWNPGFCEGSAIATARALLDAAEPILKRIADRIEQTRPH